MPLLPVAKLIELAKSGPSRTLPPETRQSYPIPVREGKRLQAAFIYAPQGRANPIEGLHLLTPTFLAFLDAETGKFERIRMLQPNEFGQKHAPGDDIGTHRMPEGLNVSTFYPEQDRLFSAYDLLLPAFASGQTEHPAEISREGAEFRRLFPWLAESPLMPYYHAVGATFFPWVNRIPREAQ